MALSLRAHHPARLPRPAGPAIRDCAGQSIVEFALLLPVFFLVLIGLIELSFVWNSRNTVLFAARDGSMLAAEGGNNYGTDCFVLDRVEKDVTSPASAVRVQQVQIYWSDRNGAQVGTSANVY